METTEMSIYTQKDRETLRVLEQTVERGIGCKAADIRNVTLDRQRSSVERQQGHRLVFRRAFPVIGRGNIMGDRTLSREEVNLLVDKALR
ncbi:MAG: hypothetical protein PHV28_05145 [Kiritimatiellae bacterium]|nr:hypothetical protein [Kiritimatiellia bacterium]